MQTILDLLWLKYILAHLYFYSEKSLIDTVIKWNKYVRIKTVEKENVEKSEIQMSTLTSWYSFFSQAKSRSKVEQRLLVPPDSSVELGSNLYFTANGGFELQLELKLLRTPLEW